MQKIVGIKKADSWKMFNRISKRYDLVNNVLTCGIVFHWRKKLVQQFTSKPIKHALDLASGTGEVLFSIMKSKHQSIEQFTGLDLAQEMLNLAEKKNEQLAYKDKINFVNGSALDIPFEDNSLDAITMSFGIRNVSNEQQCIKEMHRTLKPGAKTYIMEFGLPNNFILKRLYLFYFRYILPTVSGLISGDKKAYNYLNQSVEDFPYGKRFVELMEKEGFKAKAIPYTFGINYLYIGEK